MGEGIEGGDAAGPADRLGKEWWAGRWVWCCAGCSVWALGGGRPAGAGGLRFLAAETT